MREQVSCRKSDFGNVTIPSAETETNVTFNSSFCPFGPDPRANGTQQTCQPTLDTRTEATAQPNHFTVGKAAFSKKAA